MSCTDTIPERNRDSLEYLTVSATADQVLDTQTVEIAITRSQPTAGDWLPAEWIGAAGTTRQARLTPAQVGTTRGPGTWYVFLRITDSPEIPVLPVGPLVIT